MTKFSTFSVLGGLAIVVNMLAAAEVPVRAQEARQAAAPLPPGEGREIVAVACNQCHGAGVVTKLREGQKGWNGYVRDMILYGAQVQPHEIDTVVQYLVKNFGPNSQAVAATANATAVALPAGAGKELVETRCVMCHDLERVVGLKRGKQDWEGIVANMVDRGAIATPEEARTIMTYLVAQFGRTE
jgi:cytochrome c5